MNSKKRPSINLPLFINNLSESFSSSDHVVTNKSPRHFETGVVGLGIVAAMNHNHDDNNDEFSSSVTTRVVKMAISPRSEPIPIAKIGDQPILEKEDMKLSESYTCVISHLGNGNGKNSIRKREYFDVPDDDKNGGNLWETYSNSGLFFTSSPKNTEAEALFQTADFLGSCYLCRKKLHGLDIFMYRGDKAFCSAECRYKKISSDERREKCGSGVLKSFAYSVSPCSAPRIYSTGVAAA